MRKRNKTHPMIGDKIVLDDQEYIISGLATRKYTEIELVIYLADSEGEFQRAVSIDENVSGTSYNDPRDLKYFSLDNVKSMIRSKYE